MRCYDIPGAKNVSQDAQYSDPTLCQDFLGLYERFKERLVQEADDGKPVSYMRFGDGDYFFLTKQAIGSASPGRRALSLPYDRIDHAACVDGVRRNDHLCVELAPSARQRLLELYPEIMPDTPIEFFYGSVANKWLFSTFKGRLGIIGASEKIRIAKELMKHKQYQEYLGLERFEDYIELPQKFAADSLTDTERILSDQLKGAKSRVFLYGMGHVKSAMAHRLKTHHNAVYVDVGAGIDMIAGVIDFERPYAAGWVNHRLRWYDYSGVDFMYFKEQPTDVWLG